MVKHSYVSNSVAESPQPLNFIIFYNFTSYLEIPRIWKS